MTASDNSTTNGATNDNNTTKATAIPPAIDPHRDQAEAAQLLAKCTQPEENGEPKLGDSSAPVAEINLEAIAKVVDCHYDAGRKSWWTRVEDGQWIEVPESHVRNKLKRAGLRGKAGEWERLSEVNAFLLETIEKRYVVYAGPLAGWNAGVHTICGNRVLVTQSPNLCTPTPGEWPTIRAVIEGMLDRGEIKQSIYFHLWLKAAWIALKARKLMPGQALAFVGPAGCGKSLLQQLVTNAFGGRSAKAFRYLTGDTTFNYELFAAEHLCMEDEQSRLSPQERARMASVLKEFCVNVVQSCHAKGRNAVSLTPFWRCTLSMNDEGENINALPALDPSIKDKIIILKCHNQSMPMPTDTPDERTAFWAKLVAEMPHYLHWLEQVETPSELRDSRYGLKAFQHPTIVEDLEDVAPEMRLLDLIDQSIFSDGKVNEWQGKASKLQSVLYAHEGIKVQAQQLLKYTSYAGIYLGKLAVRQRNRVQKAPQYGRKREWILKRG